MNVKTGLMYSPLTSKVYWGKMNTESGLSIGNSQKDITSDFIGIMLQKFPVNTSQNITANGKLEAVVIVLDETKNRKYQAAPEMFELLETCIPSLCDPGTKIRVRKLLAEIRGE